MYHILKVTLIRSQSESQWNASAYPAQQ